MPTTTHSNGGSTLRMIWDASILEVSTLREAVAKAKKLGLVWFDLEEWDPIFPGWKPAGTWATDSTGRFLSIPGNE